MTPSTHNTEGQKVCKCGMPEEPICSQSFVDNGAGWCGNTHANGGPCSHTRACHTPTTPAEVIVSISLEHASAILALMDSELCCDELSETEVSARTSLRTSIIASTQSTEGK